MIISSSVNFFCEEFIEFKRKDQEILNYYAELIGLYSDFSNEDLDSIESVFYDKQTKKIFIIFTLKSKLITTNNNKNYYYDVESVEFNLPNFNLKGKQALYYLINGDNIIDSLFIIKLIKKEIKKIVKERTL